MKDIKTPNLFHKHAIHHQKMQQHYTLPHQSLISKHTYLGLSQIQHSLRTNSRDPCALYMVTPVVIVIYTPYQ